MEVVCLEPQRLVGAKAQGPRAPGADLHRLGPRKMRRKMRGAATTNKKFVLEPSLVHRGGLDVDLYAGVLQ
jgi:hypothetical protein